MSQTLFLLLPPLIRFHFDARHDVLQSSPLFGSHRHELETKLLATAPPHDRLLDSDGWFVIISFDQHIEGRTRLNLGQTGDSAATNRKIDDIAFTADHINGGKGTPKTDYEARTSPFLHR